MVGECEHKIDSAFVVVSFLKSGCMETYTCSSTYTIWILDIDNLIGFHKSIKISIIFQNVKKCYYSTHSTSILFLPINWVQITSFRWALPYNILYHFEAGKVCVGIGYVLYMGYTSWTCPSLCSACCNSIHSTDVWYRRIVL